MDISNAMRAEILTHALPYIMKYSNKTVVIKYGGSAMLNEELKQSVMHDITLLSLIGIKVVLVHGGGPEITEMLKKIGKESVFHNGLRVTDAETAEIVQMVLAGKINKSLVNLIETIGGNAIGLCGLDGQMLKVSPIDEALGFVGDISDINIKPICDILDKDYIPVVSSIGRGPDGCVYNINADAAAAKIAGALKAECLISLTDTPGILHDKDKPDSLIPIIHASEVPKLMHDGVISGGMIPKTDCCVEAIRRGVKKVFIIDGRIQHSILIELLTDEGIGTMFC